MQFFFYEIVARIVAAYLCFDCYRQLRSGLAERKIEYFNPGLINSILDAFLDDSLKVVHRDTAPIRYWLEIGIYGFLLVSCFGVAILGWWHPDT